MAKIEYDEDVNILNIRLKDTKVVDTDTRGNCILDFDARGDVVNIEVLDYNLEDVLSLKKKK